MHQGVVKVYKTSRICIFHGITNKELLISNIFDKISDMNVDTLIVSDVLKNAKFYYVNKGKFPTVNKLVYLDTYSGSCINGIYQFDEIFTTKRYTGIYESPRIKILSDEMVDEYQKLIYKPIEEKNIQQYDAKVIELDEIKPIFEVLE
jgi:hypothetical protein